MPFLTNLVRVDATFDQVDMFDTSTVEVEIPSIKVDKSCNAVDGVWIGDELTYTINISNQDSAAMATGLSFSDTIDPALARLVENSVTVRGQSLSIDTDFDYDPVSGALTIPKQGGSYVMPNITPGGSYTVTFRVTKV